LASFIYSNIIVVRNHCTTGVEPFESATLDLYFEAAHALWKFYKRIELIEKVREGATLIN